MKGILLTPVRAADERPEVFVQLAKALRLHKHKLNTEVLSATETALGTMETSSLVKLYRNIQKNIHTSDFIVCEISSPSSGIGYLVAQAINEHKPVLALVQSGTSRAPLPLLAKDTKFVSFYNYDSAADIPFIVDSFLRKIKSMVDYRFVLLLPPKLDSYLDWVTSEHDQHKSEVIRKAIMDQIKTDTEYQKFMSEESEYLIEPD